MGTADVWEAFASRDARSLPRLLASLPDTGMSGARYYGGTRFDAMYEPDEEWAAFGAYRFVLPRFELHADDAETTLVCNLVLPRDMRSASEILQEIRRPFVAEGATGACRCQYRSLARQPRSWGLDQEHRASPLSVL